MLPRPRLFLLLPAEGDQAGGPVAGAAPWVSREDCLLCRRGLFVPPEAAQPAQGAQPGGCTTRPVWGLKRGLGSGLWGAGGDRLGVGVP